MTTSVLGNEARRSVKMLVRAHIEIAVGDVAEFDPQGKNEDYSTEKWIEFCKERRHKSVLIEDITEDWKKITVVFETNGTFAKRWHSGRDVHTLDPKHFIFDPDASDGR